MHLISAPQALNSRKTRTGNYGNYGNSGDFGNLRRSHTLFNPAWPVAEGHCRVTYDSHESYIDRQGKLGYFPAVPGLISWTTTGYSVNPEAFPPDGFERTGNP